MTVKNVRKVGEKKTKKIALISCQILKDWPGRSRTDRFYSIPAVYHVAEQTIDARFFSFA